MSSPTSGAAISDDAGHDAPGIPASIARNSITIAISSAITAVVGLVYWIVMGRLYPAAEVGAAAAVITTATTLAAFGNLGVGPYFERFLPVAGAGSHRLAQRGLLIGGLCGAALGAGFLLFGPTDEMFLSGAQMAFFPVVVAGLSSFALLDHISIALRQARWAARKNIAHAIIKLVAAASLATVLGRSGMVGTWTLVAMVASAIVWWVARKDLHRRSAAATATHALPPRAELRRFLLVNYGIYIASAITPLLLPLIVIGRVGADQNAYFAIVWSLVGAVFALLTMLMGPYVAAASADEDALRPLTFRFIAIMGGVAVAASVGFVTIGPVVLHLAGPAYAEHGIPLLRIAAVGVPLAAVGLVFTAVSRVRRRLAPALGVQIISAAIMLGLTELWISDYGIEAAGWAMVCAEGTTAVLVAIPLILAVRSFSSRQGLSAADR